MDITLILPVFNERQNLPPLFKEIEDVLVNYSKSFEIIAIDDGSTDGSSQYLQELALNKPYLKVIFFRKNSGQTAAFDAGFRMASGQIIVTLDSDRQNDPHDIPKMIALLDQGYDFVAGWRKNRKDGFFLRIFPSLLANWFIRTITGTKIHDLGCSLKVYRKEITDELRLHGEMHRFLGVLVEGLGAKVIEFEVHHRTRVSGKSKYGITRTFKVILDLITVWFMQSYRSKPIYVFGGIGLLLLNCGFFSSLWILYQKFELGIWVHKNPLFSLAVMFIVLGVQFLGMGLIAEMIIRTYFESLNKYTYSIASFVGFPKNKLPSNIYNLNPLPSNTRMKKTI